MIVYIIAGSFAVLVLMLFIPRQTEYTPDPVRYVRIYGNGDSYAYDDLPENGGQLVEVVKSGKTTTVDNG